MPDERTRESSSQELPADGQGEQRRLMRSRSRQWQPPTRQHFNELLQGVLEQADHREYRLSLGQARWVLMDRTWYRRGRAADARKLRNKFRCAAAVIPVLATEAGGSLVGYAHATAGTTIGWVAIVGGLADAAINAVRPAVEYGLTWQSPLSLSSCTGMYSATR